MAREVDSLKLAAKRGSATVHAARRVAIFVATWAAAFSLQAGTLPVWELEGTENKVRLMGSIHFLREADYPLPGAMDQAVEDADTLVMEIALNDLDPLQAAQTMQELGADPAGRGLREILGIKDYGEAQRRAQSLGLDLGLFDGNRPWFVGLMITQFRLMQLGFDPRWGIEQQLQSHANRDGKPIQGLETIDEQLQALAGLPMETQSRFLLQTLEDAAQIEEELDAIVAAWRSGDTATLEELMLNSLKDTPALYDSLLVQRNRNWTSSIRSLVDGPDDYLIVVGAMHLVGDDSLLEMLSAEGYPAKQLRDD